MRRIAALWLPRLLCEIAREGGDERENVPASRLGVVVDDTASSCTEPVGSGLLAGVSDAAHKAGARIGQTVVEARAIVSDLVVRRIARADVDAALGRIAEVTLAFSPTVAIALGDETEPYAPLPDTVWVDLTGCAHLLGGEPAAACELASRVQSLGHAVRVTIADGPRLARAVARYSTCRETIVPPEQGARRMAELPLDALPFDRSLLSWFARLGIFSVGDLVRLPPGPTFDRLGRSARKILELALGRDEAPLVTYELPRAPREAIEWDDDLVTSTEALEFAARGLVARLSARLEGRGESAETLSLELGYDRSLARLEGVHGSKAIDIDLPLPLWRKEDLFRIVKSKLEQTRVEAPVRSFALVARRLVRASKVQLGFGEQGRGSPEQLAILIAELSSELGRENVGMLEAPKVHRPEGRSRLRPALSILRGVLEERRARSLALSPERGHAGGSGVGSVESLPGFWPSRVLAEPVRLQEGVAQGKLVSIDRRLFRVERMHHAMRLDGVEWWTRSPVSRDYVRAWLSGASADYEAWIFFDRAHGGAAFLHGWYD